MEQTTPRAHPPREKGDDGIEYSRIACDQCHRCKLKCTRELPQCERCRHNDSPCTFSTGKPIGKPKGSKNKNSKKVRKAAEAAAKVKAIVDRAKLSEPLQARRARNSTDSFQTPPPTRNSQNYPGNTRQQDNSWHSVGSLQGGNGRDVQFHPHQGSALAHVDDSTWAYSNSAHLPTPPRDGPASMSRHPTNGSTHLRPDDTRYRAGSLYATNRGPRCLCGTGRVIQLAEALDELLEDSFDNRSTNESSPTSTVFTDAASMDFERHQEHHQEHSSSLDHTLHVLNTCIELGEHSLKCRRCTSYYHLSKTSFLQLIHKVIGEYAVLISSLDASINQANHSMAVDGRENHFHGGAAQQLNHVSIGELEIGVDAQQLIIRAVIDGEIKRAMGVLAVAEAQLRECTNVQGTPALQSNLDLIQSARSQITV